MKWLGLILLFSGCSFYFKKNLLPENGIIGVTNKDCAEKICKYIGKPDTLFFNDKPMFIWKIDE